MLLALKANTDKSKNTLRKKLTSLRTNSSRLRAENNNDERITDLIKQTIEKQNDNIIRILNKNLTEIKNKKIRVIIVLPSNEYVDVPLNENIETKINKIKSGT